MTCSPSYSKSTWPQPKEDSHELEFRPSKKEDQAQAVQRTAPTHPPTEGDRSQGRNRARARGSRPCTGGKRVQANSCSATARILGEKELVLSDCPVRHHGGMWCFERWFQFQVLAVRDEVRHLKESS